MTSRNLEQTCPYDETHQITKSLQRHLAKCEKNNCNKRINMKICPFNSTHIESADNFDYHVANCEDAKRVVAYTHSTNDAPLVGQVPIEEIQKLNVPWTENWDAEPEIAAYNPDEHTQTRNILRTIQGASKSERKKFRKQERERLTIIAAQQSQSKLTQPNKGFKSERKDVDKENSKKTISNLSESVGVILYSKKVKQPFFTVDKSDTMKKTLQGKNVVKELEQHFQTLSVQNQSRQNQDGFNLTFQESSLECRSTSSNKNADKKRKKKNKKPNKFNLSK